MRDADDIYLFFKCMRDRKGRIVAATRLVGKRDGDLGFAQVIGATAMSGHRACAAARRYTCFSFVFVDKAGRDTCTTRAALACPRPRRRFPVLRIALGARRGRDLIRYQFAFCIVSRRTHGVYARRSAAVRRA